MNSEQFRHAAHQIVDYVINYFDNIRNRQVLPSVEPHYLEKLIPSEAPRTPESWEDVFNDLEKIILPGVTHWNSPRFHAFFPSSNSYPPILADILCNAFTNIGFSWIASPVCTELEMVMMNWLGKILKLPESMLFSPTSNGGGVIQGTASEAALTCLLAARHQVLKKENVILGNKLSKLVAYASCQAHSSIEKACMLGAVTLRLLDTDENNCLQGSELKKAMEEDIEKGLIPFFVVITLGTTNTCAFDNLLECGKICKNLSNVWLHIDAAYAGSAFICPEYRYLLDGIEYADSFNFNLHKWLMVNFDCSALWIKNSESIVDAFNVNPVYLRHEKQGQIPDYRHWQIPLGRRFRSLKIWFTLRLYGIEGLQNHIRIQISLAKQFQELLKNDTRFEIISINMGLCTFRLKGSNELNEKLMKKITERKKIFLTPCIVKGKYIIRFAIASKETIPEDVIFSWNEIQTVTDIVLSEK